MAAQPDPRSGRDFDDAADDAAENTQSDKPQPRKEDLLDEGLEETFPASDPMPAQHID